MPFVLAVDDDPAILRLLALLFGGPGDAFLTAPTAARGLELVAQSPPDVVLLDVHLPDLSGLETFRRIRALDARIPVIFVTGSGATDTAIEAMKLGAYDYLLKEDLAGRDRREAVRKLVERAGEVGRSMRVPALRVGDDPDAPPADGLVGRSPAMREVYKAIGRVAGTDATVLILGESGTGKELVARAIYQHSRRADKPFLPINCAAIPEPLLESELFGHEKGAFTGADRQRVGKFEQANGGTLFLDEVGDMTPLTQTKLLRVLQDQRFERVGGSTPVATDVRLIGATNRDLKGMVAHGRFRGDLFYRLSVFTIRLPPLRDRADDIPLLVTHFLRRFNRELGKDVREVSEDALAALRRYPWPGNLRELQSVLKQAMIQMTGPILLASDLPAAVVEARPGAPSVIVQPDLPRFIAARLRDGTENLHAEATELFERTLLTAVLRHTGGNLTQAARVLGITRNSLRFKLKSLKLDPRSSDDRPGDPVTG